MKVRFVDLRTQYENIRDEIDSAIRDVISESAFVGGRFVRSFEENFAAHIGAKHCVGVGNGTDALYLALRAFGAGPGDEVITPANTFIATAEAISLTGATPVFVDCDEDTYNISIGAMKKAVTARTKAIVPVHLYGQPADMDAIVETARSYGLHVIEDCAQAVGATYKGASVGTIGDCGCFSFFPGKNLGAYGDGGAVVTNNEIIATKVRMLANHGRINKYDHEFVGLNSRLDGLQAAVLDVKLQHLDRWNRRRQAVAAIYDKNLGDLVPVPAVLEGTSHVYHLYVIRVCERERVIGLLAEQGIATGVHYPVPLPLLMAYRHQKRGLEDFPAAVMLKDEILSLPIHGDMTDQEAKCVVGHVRKIVKRHYGARHIGRSAKKEPTELGV